MRPSTFQPWIVLSWLGLLPLLTAAGSLGSAPAALAGYARSLPEESPPARQQRHARVAQRRAAAVLLICHRGASTLATENTLEAYAAAMDYGADGCEVDVRRCVDGVFALFHDDMLDRLTDGFGQAEDLTYPELITLQPQLRIGTANARTRPPTFTALLLLARQRAMLLHLDVKLPGLDEDIARILEEADMWDHVVAINTETLPKLLKDPRLKLLRYKGAAYEARRDLDPAAVREVLAKPGQLLILEDPRLAAQTLQREAYRSVPLPKEAFAKWTPADAPAHGTAFVPARFLRSLKARVHPDSAVELLELLRLDDPAARRLPSRDAAAERRRTERIVECAWAAERLGQLGRRTSQLVESLKVQALHPSLHTNWLYQGLDAHTAVRALGRLGVTEVVPGWIERFRTVDPDLALVQNPAWTNNPLAWVDWRKLSIVPVLGELRTVEGKKFLLEYVALSETQAAAWSVPQFEAAAAALFRYRLESAEIQTLLRSSNSAVRGTAILECLDHPATDRTAALKEAAPWALTLPRPRH
jgi:glycerophosphoryl diester phosphodiesterase